MDNISGSKEPGPGAEERLFSQARQCAEFSVNSGRDAALFSFYGPWTIETLDGVERRLRAEVAGASARSGVIFDLQGLVRLDTSGALLINKALDICRKKGRPAELRGTADNWRALLELSDMTGEPEAVEKTGRPGAVVAFLNVTGEAIVRSVTGAAELTGFLGKFLASVGWLLLHPRKMRWTSLVFHMEQTGLRAIPIVALLTFLIGMVVAYMGSQQLQKFGAQVFAVNLLEVSTMREMGVLITSIVVAGRSSSSFTAQIGAMMANEEVAAIRSMGLDPVILLVVPRVVALVLMLPLLVFIAGIMSLLGGAVALQFTMDMSFRAFVDKYHEIALLQNFLVGMSKAPFFALIIGIVGCFHGFKATSSAESVGFLTTVSVVQAIFLVIIVDALFAIFFSTIGI